jgi:hypothetical protein
MLFSIIYSVNVPKDKSIKCGQPPKLHNWQLTERSEGNPDDFLTEIEGYKHRKYVAILDKKHFEEFLNDLSLTAENVETMGSLGAPGFGPVIVPAISFRSELAWYYDSIDASAYVTPIPRVQRDWSERDWQRIRKVVIGMYGH